jgi:4-hydroxybenzoate polyprenyl transferase
MEVKPYISPFKILLPYYKLARLDKLAGAWLLLWPSWWGIAFASNKLPELKLLVIFMVGSVLMRSAGCIINDIIDRNIDNKVTRTKNRPLASGELGLKQAVIALASLLCIALCLLLLLPKASIILGLMSIIPIIIYPFMKRFTYWPQAFLGITYNLSALIGWAAVQGSLNFAALCLYLACIFWTLGYDTIYAHQDKIDDFAIGVKSTALLFGSKTKNWLAKFYFWFWANLFVTGKLVKLSNYFYIVMILVAFQLSWQIYSVKLNEPLDCMNKFKSNIILGIIVFAAILAGKF